MKRFWGLDLLRSIAIIGVLLSHFNQHLTGNIATKTIFPVGGVLGVELFFVLSGFLIGGILIHKASKGELFRSNGLITFYKRRWFRTLPNYYLFLAVYLYLQWPNGHDILLAYATFTQNFAWNIPANFFGVSWSLTIEEIFYLILPIAIIIGYKMKLSRPIALGLFSIIAIPLALRLYFMTTGVDDPAFYRKAAIIRLDSIGVGVGMAAIRYYLPAIWNHLVKQGALLLLPLWIIFIYHDAKIVDHHDNPVIYYPIASAFAALTIPFFYSLNHTGFLRKPVQFTSAISYSLYLAHIAVLIVLTQKLHIKNYLEGYPLFFTFVVTSFASAFIIWNFWESPWMTLRDKKITLKFWLSNKYKNIFY